ncbi:thioesterase domain-containing protein [Amycolatopsis sp., V23-08]|uniref:Thioesterase domain-containing protein n=1 Tax=Amycolatopsis heterodermiae TaxID=3110235 RepID=A0ABU5R401_9PSEU|nr:alpha/beta fold hydrolase [Amycolatopsis sp., V23-08]MEA5360943.1 thioesterase domain-containing protein [Amycolatopsis sp., V23-08]
MPATATAAPPLLLPLSRRPDAPQAVLVHPGGGGLSPYTPLALRLARRGGVSGIRAGGLFAGERPDDDIETMTERYLPLLDTLPRRPDLLVGWSMGGVLAWELGARLSATGPAPAVVMIDSFTRRDEFGAAHRDVVVERIMRSVHAKVAPPDQPWAEATAHAHVTASGRHRVTSAHPGRALLMACASPQRRTQVESWARLSGRLRVRELDCGHFDVFDGKALPAVLAHLDDFLTGERNRSPKPLGGQR